MPSSCSSRRRLRVPSINASTRLYISSSSSTLASTTHRPRSSARCAARSTTPRSSGIPAVAVTRTSRSPSSKPHSRFFLRAMGASQPRPSVSPPPRSRASRGENQAACCPKRTPLVEGLRSNGASVPVSTSANPAERSTSFAMRPSLRAPPSRQQLRAQRPQRAPRSLLASTGGSFLPSIQASRWSDRLSLINRAQPDPARHQCPSSCSRTRRREKTGSGEFSRPRTHRL